MKYFYTPQSFDYLQFKKELRSAAYGDVFTFEKGVYDVYEDQTDKAYYAVSNCDAGVKLEVDTSDVNLKTVGTYDVIYRATDAAGNVTELRRTLSVYEEEITEEMLNDLETETVDMVPNLPRSPESSMSWFGV